MLGIKVKTMLSHQNLNLFKSRISSAGSILFDTYWFKSVYTCLSLDSLLMIIINIIKWETSLMFSYHKKNWNENVTWYAPLILSLKLKTRLSSLVPPNSQMWGDVTNSLLQLSLKTMPVIHDWHNDLSLRLGVVASSASHSKWPHITFRASQQILIQTQHDHHKKTKCSGCVDKVETQILTQYSHYSLVWEVTEKEEVTTEETQPTTDFHNSMQ